MSEAHFADNLYGGSSILKGGTGLLGFCHAAGWCYERHANACRPGLWRVATYAQQWDELAEEFHETLASANAVVDDFGSLRRVS